MIKEGKYTLGELMAILAESTEYKPVKGPKVDDEEQRKNEKAVSDITKSVEKYDGGPRERKRPDNNENFFDPNKTTLDVRFDYNPGNGYNERVQAQVEGYNSKQEKDRKEKEDEENHVDREGNKKWYEDQKEKNGELNDRHAEIKHAGLKTRMFPISYVENNTLFKKNEAMKRLHFKNTVFLSEAQMLKRVPDTYKTDGNTFIMRDATGTDYVVECRVDDKFGYKQLTVLNKMNKQSVNEELNRMRSLYEYKNEESKANAGDMSALLETVRQLEEKK